MFRMHILALHDAGESTARIAVLPDKKSKDRLRLPARLYAGMA